MIILNIHQNLTVKKYHALGTQISYSGVRLLNEVKIVKFWISFNQPTINSWKILNTKYHKK